MAKIVTKMGVCSVKRKAMGCQFVAKPTGYTLEGAYTISGSSAIMSTDDVSGNLAVGAGYSAGCKYCGNKFMYRCGGCGTFVCYNGAAQRNATCPICGAVAEVPASRNNQIPVSGARSGGAGGAVRLAQGEEVKISFAEDNPLSGIEVGVGWDPVSSGERMDVDSSVVVLSPSGGARELVYYGAKEHSSGCVIHHGDNTTGTGEGDDENISVYLNKVPADRDRLVFVLNIYHCEERNQTLRVVKNLYIRLFDPKTKKTLIEYRVDANFARSNDTAMVIGMAFRKGGGWSFKAVGKTFYCATVGELSRLCDRYL